MKIYYVITAAHSKNLSVVERMADAEEIAENWRRDGLSPLIETVRKDELTEKEQEWLGLD